MKLGFVVNVMDSGEAGATTYRLAADAINTDQSVTTVIPAAIAMTRTVQISSLIPNPCQRALTARVVTLATVATVIQPRYRLNGSLVHRNSNPAVLAMPISTLR